MLSTMFTYLITYFGLYGDTPPPRNHWSMGFIVGSTLCLWIKFAYFSEEWQWFIWTKTLQTHIYIVYIYIYIFYRGRAHCKILPKYCIFGCCMHFGHIAKSLTIRKMTEHQQVMRENGDSLDFNFISLPNPTVDKNWVCRHRLLIVTHTMFRSIHTLYEQHIYWMFPLFCVWVDFCFTIFVCSLMGDSAKLVC